jgi:hypothetical protein
VAALIAQAVPGRVTADEDVAAGLPDDLARRVTEEAPLSERKEIRPSTPIAT